MSILDQIGHFTWSFHYAFFIETSYGNYVWNDPSYPGGDNTLKKYNGSYKQWCKEIEIPFGRDKGKHLIKDYCGTDVKII